MFNPFLPPKNLNFSFPPVPEYEINKHDSPKALMSTEQLEAQEEVDERESFTGVFPILEGTILHFSPP
jgi:hypothetical protein